MNFIIYIMNTPYLKKYQPKFYKDFTIDKEYIEF